MTKKILTVADFFCGAGGFSEGFNKNGFKVIFGLDNWSLAKENYELNHSDCDFVLMDILNLDSVEKIERIVPDTDVIIGSPPRISSSNIINSGNVGEECGLKLIKAFLRIVAWKIKKGSCKYWVLENFPNCENYIKDYYTWDDLDLPGGEGVALVVKQKNILNTAEYGTPQIRKRFVCGDFVLPEKTHEKEDSWINISHVQKSLTNPLSIKKPFSVIDPVYGFYLSSEKLTDHFYDSTLTDVELKSMKTLKEEDVKEKIGFFTENISKPCRQILNTMGMNMGESLVLKNINQTNDVEYRLPTIRETASFMSVPITYQFKGSIKEKYELIGNVVCCKLAGALAKAILKKELIKKEILKPLEV